ncbi:MAG: exodeoxyribonuclease VII small subunit [Holosporaceae bacterium]|jgi:exodeoxyribonuclease VII small subunit|nr:exodeoxyribonuclease VII small subunit [Holosporaceae bacterium]
MSQYIEEEEMTQQKKEIDKMEFEDALKELEEIVAILEEGKSSLKNAVDLYERGIKLKKHCDKILESAQLRINQISSDKNNNIVIETKEMDM